LKSFLRLKVKGKKGVRVHRGILEVPNSIKIGGCGKEVHTKLVSEREVSGIDPPIVDGAPRRSRRAVLTLH